MIGGVVGKFVLPVMPGDVEPDAGEDARGMGMVMSWGSATAIQVGGRYGGIGDRSKITDIRMVDQ